MNNKLLSGTYCDFQKWEPINNCNYKICAISCTLIWDLFQMKVSSIVNFIINNSYLRCVSSSAILNSCSGYSLTVMKTIKQTFQVNNLRELIHIKFNMKKGVLTFSLYSLTSWHLFHQWAPQVDQPCPLQHSTNSKNQITWLIIKTIF